MATIQVLFKYYYYNYLLTLHKINARLHRQNTNILEDPETIPSDLFLHVFLYIRRSGLWVTPPPPLNF